MVLTALPNASFYYFAYGSCMCPVDLKRSLGEPMQDYVIGTATLAGYRLGFFKHSERRNCGVLDVVPDPTASVEGVLYCLPLRGWLLPRDGAGDERRTALFKRPHLQRDRQAQPGTCAQRLVLWRGAAGGRHLRFARAILLAAISPYA
jgi:hypothetical protein